MDWLDLEEGRFVWVARYDTAGGGVHRDRNRIAPHETTPYLPGEPRGLEMARRDLREGVDNGPGFSHHPYQP
ncbi:DUF7718 family protein [Thermus islandicus]|uniref:DUF7718 family protein n=1 Tax=Thermus islandicus TaxID=540988 RepID=UPI003F6DAD3A